MSYIYRKGPSYASGLCATLNNSINVCLQYYKMFQNYDLVLDVHELHQIFDFRVSENGLQNFEQIWLNSNFDNSSNAHTICDLEKVKEKNRIFNNFFSYKDEKMFQQEANKYINEKTLGLQIRGTDKTKEISAPDINNILDKIRSMLEKHEIDNIYLATDDQYYKDIILNEFGSIVKTRDVTISLDRQPIHFIEDRSSINLEVMTDVYLLSKCRYFLYCFSNVSYSALVLGANDFKDIDCIN